MNYLAYGVVVSSEMPLPELVPIEGGRPCLTVTLAPDSLPANEWSWIQPPSAALAANDGMWVAVAKHHRRHRLLFDGGAVFTVAVDEGRIVADATTGDAFTIRHLLIDQVIPRVLSHQGRFVLHAGAFLTPYGAVAAIGSAGAGKSTLSASFGLHGMPIISDDALVVERVADELFATPAYPSLRLWPERLPALSEDRDPPHLAPHTDKRRLGRQEGLLFAEGPAALRRIYAIREEGAPRVEIRPLSPREGIMALLGNSYVLDPSDRRRLGDQFASICAACSVADVRQLAYPRQFSALPLVREAILKDLSGP